MRDDGGDHEMDIFDSDHEELELGAAITPILFANPMEEAANRYWRASLVWRGKMEANWTFSDAIDEARDLQRYRGVVFGLSCRLLDDIVHDRRQDYATANDSHQVA